MAPPADIVPEPRAVAPSMKFTVPVGVPEVALTLAVKVTAFSNNDMTLLLVTTTLVEAEALVSEKLAVVRPDTVAVTV